MNRVVVVTGACGGLGVELAKKFLQFGDTVFGIDLKKDKVACAAIGSSGFRLLTGDLTAEKSVKALVAAILKQAGRIDLLINNAGYCGPLTRVEDSSLKDFQKHMKRNLLTAFLMCKYAIPGMLRQKQGLIINISSMAGTRAVPRLMAYSASKFGVLALSQCIAKENLETGLRCVTVCPGGMNTPMRRELFGSEAAARQQTPVFMADIISQVADGKIEVLSGGRIVIRYGKITEIAPPPAA
ncbi:MAG TPA: SDR family oxidoreductase [Candidatus Omnitrophota bacterium]|nr:SDR family oxidoreductase [Candidatus Omnitrophota bacterium]